MRRRAFTLIEILISILILAIIIAGICMSLDRGGMAYNTDMGLLDLQQQLRQAMYWAGSELREAITIIGIPSNGQSITFDTVAAIGVRYYYDAAQSQFVREYPAGTSRVLSNYITQVSFCCWHDDTSTCDTDCSGSSLVEIQLNADRNIKGRILPFSLKERIRPRNIR